MKSHEAHCLDETDHDPHSWTYKGDAGCTSDWWCNGKHKVAPVFDTQPCGITIQHNGHTWSSPTGYHLCFGALSSEGAKA